MEYLNKLLKITTKDNRIILGHLKSVDYLGNFYISHSVEVFDKEGDFYSPLEIYNNTDDCQINFHSNKNLYQITGNTIIKLSSISKIETER